MADSDAAKDAVIVGGGFFGAAIAIYLAQQRGLKRILLLEREPALLTRASYNNQARVHNGYHYPRSFTTAYRSRVNLPRFVRDWPQAVKQDFIKLYAIARQNSKVTAKQFQRFCLEIGAKIQPVDRVLHALFEPRLIEEVFQVEEYAFDSTKLADWAEREMLESGVEVRLRARATAIFRTSEGQLSVTFREESGREERVSSRYVFNCTYSGLNQLGGISRCPNGTQAGSYGDGFDARSSSAAGPRHHSDGRPILSMMPFPAREVHTLSHVRYTPHLNWQDQPGIDPYKKLADYERHTRVHRMVRDVSRYIPAIGGAKYLESLFEVKTVLNKNEIDDGRPILFEKHEDLPGCYSVLGGKIDNIYDVLEKLADEDLSQ